ncbi:phospholipase DDHD1 isoform X3 [Hydra vulgaris]|uniref:Phospholipase DDHD1 isoform X3 n=1 Tax=Hydra vulgaris TaxID=6087 RepID=A0ABM4C0K7_HYDVU
MASPEKNATITSQQKGTTLDLKIKSSRPLTLPHATLPSVQKHFEFLQPLSSKKVRWFFQEEKKWIPFNGSDSLKIETIFRSLPSNMQSPSFSSTNVNIAVELPVVRGSLFEVNILNRECISIFWKENNIPVMRGTWFKGTQQGNWEPLDENQAFVIEEAHCGVVRSLGMGTLDMNTSNNVIHKIKLDSNRVEWHEISQVYMFSESAGSRFVQRIGFNGAVALHRGYNIDCDESDDYEEISHIVFLVHGIGQMYCDGGGVLHNRKNFVNTIEKINKQFYKDKKHHGRIEYFPIEWRTKLKLDEGIIKTVTPSNISSLRNVINGTTLDVLYYTSPLYKEEIISMLRQILNSVYKQYTKKNPSFEKNGGKVSIIAHSLGSVIVYDVLSCWNSHLIEEDKKSADLQVAVSEKSYSWLWGWSKEHHAETKTDPNNLHYRLYKARLEVSNLEYQLAANDNENKLSDKFYSLCFKVENVFNIGSPLAVFLIMRGIRPQSDVEQHILPTSVCKRLFNIYDPADPLAYRLEPLIYEHYSNIPPVRVTQIYSELEKSKYQAAGSTTHGNWLTALFKAGKEIESHVELSNDLSAASTASSAEKDSKKSGIKNKSENVGVKTLVQRIDYVLEQSIVEYLSAITSHQAYWQSLDFAKFVLQITYADDDELQNRQSCRL